MRWVLYVLIFSFVILLCNSEPAFTQDRCDELIDQLDPAIDECSELSLNWACYGNSPTVASPPDIQFYEPSDQQPLSVLATINTEAPAGAAVMYLQKINNSEGSPLQVIVFGGANLTSQDSDYSTFLIGTGDNRFLCADTLPGMVVRTATEKRGSITVNGVLIELESSAYLTMLDPDTMAVVNLEGEVSVIVGGERQQLPVGYQSNIVGIVVGQPALAGPPFLSVLFNSAAAQWLATNENGLRQISAPKVESADVPACGGNIAFGETVTAEIPTAGGECLYTFCSQEGREATINVEGGDATLDPWVGLRGPGDTLLKYNNDISEQNLNSRICNSTLPVLGCYTIVVRSNNDNAGLFRLSLNQQTTCALPVPRCEVVALGLNQREGPGLDSPVIRTLPQGTQLRPLESSADGQWARVLVAGTSLEGWVNTSAQYLACEALIPHLVPIIEPTATQTTVIIVEKTSEPTATKGPKEDGPFGGP